MEIKAPPVDPICKDTGEYCLLFVLASFMSLALAVMIAVKYAV